MMEIESGSTDVLKNFDVPIGDPVLTRLYIHDDDAVIELMNPGRSLTETLELALRVDIEHKEAADTQMPTCCRKERSPRLERHEVIEGIEHTNHDVELFSERERSDVSFYETSTWNTTPS